MHDQKKTKAELISELETLRKRVASLEGGNQGKQGKQKAAAGNGSSPSAEEDLAQLTTALNGMSEGVAVYDSEDKLYHWNRAFEELNPKIKPHLQRGVSFATLAHMMGAKAAEKAGKDPEQWLQERLKQRANPQGEIELQHPNGRWISGKERKVTGGGFISLISDITERKQAELGLKALNTRLEESVLEQTAEARFREHRVRSVMEAIPHGVVEIETEGTIIYANPAYYKMLGYGDQELIGKSILERAPDDTQREGLSRVLQQLMENPHQPESFQVVWHKKNGEPIDLQVDWDYKRDLDGMATGFVCVLTDIGVRQRAEEGLRQSEEFSRAITDSLPVLIAVLDADRRYVFANRQLQEWFDVDPATVLGVHVSEVLGEKACQKLAPYFESALAGKETSFEMEVPYAKGGTRFVQTHYVPRFGTSGEVVGLYTLANDITLRMHAQKELRASQHLLQTVFETFPHFLFVKDAAAKFVVANQNFGKSIGLEQDEWVGKTSLDLPRLSEQERKENLANDWKVLKTGKLLKNEQKAIDFEDGHREYHSQIKTPLFDAEGNVTGLFGLVEDITARVEAVEEVRASRQRLADAIESIPDAFALFDAEDRLVVYNQRFQEFFSFYAESLVPGVRYEEMLRVGLARGEFADAIGREEEWLATRMAVHLKPSGPLEQELSDGRWLRIEEKRTAEGGVVGLRTDITALKLAEAAVRASEEKFRDYAESSADWFWEMDTDLRFTYFSPNVKQIAGVAPEWHYGKTRKELLGEHYDPEVWGEHEKLLLARRPFRDFTYLRVVAGQEPRWVQTNGKPIFDPTGKFAGYRGTGRDVTPQVLAQETLRKSEQMMAQAQEVAHFGNLHWDFVLGKQHWSDEVFRILGMQPQEKEPGERTFADSLHPDDKKRALEAMAAAVATGALVNLECRIIRPNGEVRTLQANAEVSHDQAGQPRQMVGTVQDITDRKNAENALGESEKRLRLITDTVPVLIAYLDKDLTYRFVNQQYSVMLGMPQEHFIGKTIGEVLGQEALGTVKPRLASALQGNRESFQYSLRLANGEEHHLQSDYVPHFGEDGEVLGIYACATDHTENRNMEAQLRQSQKMEAIGQLAGGVAHDFNNILQVIMGNVELAMEEPKDISANLKEVASAAVGASNLTRQLLAFGRRQVLQTSVLEINDLISNLMKMVRRLIGETIELVVIPSAVLPVEADPGMMEQVLLNLAVNARDAMPGGGRLVIETHDCLLDEEFAREHPWAVPGRYVLLTVSDNGIGMTPEVQDRIFEPFFTTKALGEGTGLGLSTVYGILNQHQGMVGVYSEPGQGTTFKVYLPVTEKAVVDAGKPLPVKVVGGTETILVAEDDAGVLELVKRLLQSRGYTVLSARDGEEAVKVFEKHKEQIGLVIMDVVMPKLSGPPLFKKIRALDSHTPVLLSTGYTANAIDSEFLTQNHLRMIQKPYAPTVLFTAVRTAIEEGLLHTSLSSPRSS